MSHDFSFYYILIQIFGFIVFGIYATASFQKERKKFFIQESFGAFGMGFQTLLLGSWIGFITNSVHALMMLIARIHPELRITPKVLYSGVIVTMIASLIIWENTVIEYVCLSATLLNFWARTLKNETFLRIAAMAGCGLWILFHVLLGSWAGLFFAVIAVCGHFWHILKVYAPVYARASS